MSSDLPPDLPSKLPSGSGAISENLVLQHAAYAMYAALAGTLALDAETGLGGKLLFAGEVGAARALLTAANVAGAASLAASADPAAQRLAMRDGVVDFVVTTLDEALRILKNEIRKRQTVSVAVGLEAAEVVRQMVERGVLPDLLPPAGWSEAESGLDARSARVFADEGSVRVISAAIGGIHYTTWSVDRDAARWLPQMDASAKQIVPLEDGLRQRWLRLAPRYLGRAAQREHGVVLHADETARLREAVLGLVAELRQTQESAAAIFIGGEPLM